MRFDEIKGTFAPGPLARRVIPEPRVLRLYPTWQTYRVCRLASGIDRDSELIEVCW